MTDWTNHVTVLTTAGGSHTVDPSNPTGSGTVKDGVAFTPTAGRLLVCFVAGPVTSTTPTGWTLPTGGSSVNTDGLYAFYKTAAGSDTLATSHNSSSYQVTFDFYEFQSAASFVKAGAAFLTSGASGSLTSLTGTNLVLTGVVCPNQVGTWSYSGATAVVDFDTSTGGAHHYGLGYVSSAAASVSVSATLDTHEQVMVALAGTALPDATVLAPVATATALAPVPVVSGVSQISPVATATASAPVPAITASIPAGTDTSNSLNGRRRRARASVVVVRPAAATPSRAAVKYDKSVPYPPPTLVNGRPT